MKRAGGAATAVSGSWLSPPTSRTGHALAGTFAALRIHPGRTRRGSDPEAGSRVDLLRRQALQLMLLRWCDSPRHPCGRSFVASWAENRGSRSSSSGPDRLYEHVLSTPVAAWACD